MLGSPKSWSAGSANAGEWMRIDAGSVTSIYGVRIQRRAYYLQYVTQFSVEYSTDDATWTGVDGGRIFDGPTDEGQVDAFFANPVTARYIKITVVEFWNFPSMRAGLLGAATECPIGGMLKVEAGAARDACAAMGGRLPIVKSDEENRALFDVVRRLMDSSKYSWSDEPGGVHLGAGNATGWEGSGAWVWDDGTSFEGPHTFWYESDFKFW